MNISPTYTTAPNPTGRSVRENEAFALLDSLGIKYERVEHEAAMTIDACADIDRTLDTPLCKNLFLTNSAKTDWFLLLLPGEKPFRTRVVADQIGSTRLSFGSEDKMLEYLNLTPGSVTIMGLMYDKERKVRLLIDRELCKNEFLCFHPCINTGSVKAKTADMFGKFLEYTHHEPTFIDV